MLFRQLSKLLFQLYNALLQCLILLHKNCYCSGIGCHEQVQVGGCVLLHVGGDFPSLPPHITAHAGESACNSLLWAVQVAVGFHALPRKGLSAPSTLVGAADWPLRTAVVVFQNDVGVGAAFTAAGAVDPPVNALTLFVCLLAHSAHAQSTRALYHILFADCCDVLLHRLKVALPFTAMRVVWAVGLEVVDEPLPADIRNGLKWGLAAKRAAVTSLFPLISTVFTDGLPSTARYLVRLASQLFTDDALQPLVWFLQKYELFPKERGRRS